MQNNIRGNAFTERNVNGTDKFSRRPSLSGFEYPKDLPTNQFSTNFASIPESQYHILAPIDAVDAMNGNYEKKYTIANHNFLSENNANIINLIQSGPTTAITLDPRYNYLNSLARYSSASVFAQTPSENLYNQSSFTNSKNDPPMVYNQPTYSSTFSNPFNACNSRQIISNAQTFPSFNSQSFVPSPFMIYDHQTNSIKSVTVYTNVMHPINPEQDVNGDYGPYFGYIDNHNENNRYCSLIDLPLDDPIDLKDNYLTCQLNMAQNNLETDIVTDLTNNDLHLWPNEMPNNINHEVNRTESWSMPSLHASVESETTDEDQTNTVHGEDMLQELQKMSNLFTNVVNLPVSHHSDVGGIADFPGHSNLSRFKKTRIKERSTVWVKGHCFVKDNLVKIIPNEVTNIRATDLDRLKEMEINIFGCELPNLADVGSISSDAPECVHSSYRCQSTPIDIIYMNHSSRANQKFRSSFNSYSSNDPNIYLSQQIPSNISSRYLHRKSMQIPVRFPYVLNQIIPLLSPAVQHCNRMFFDVPNIPNSKVSRRKRRWSVSDTKFEKLCSANSVRTQNLRHSGESFQPNKCDITADYFNIRHSFDLQDLGDHAGDPNSQICFNLESKLDKQLVAMKKSILTCVENNVLEYKNEIKYLRGTQSILERQLKFYMEKVQILENSVRLNLPHEQWNLFGVSNIHG